MNVSTPEERLIVLTATHWVKYMYNGLSNHFVLLLGVLSLTTSAFAALEAVSIITFFIGSLLVLYSHHHFFHKLMSESMYDIFVTSERIIYFDDSLFFANNEHEIPLHRVAGIEAKQNGLLQNILNYGTLWIDTGGGTVDLRRIIPNVPKPEELSEKITRLLHNEGAHSQL